MQLVKYATFLRLIDENGQLSLTNLAVYLGLAVMVRQGLCGHSAVDWTGLSAFLVALVSYQTKRALLQNAAANEADARVDDALKQVATCNASVEQLGKKVTALASPERIAAIRELATRPMATQQPLRLPGDIVGIPASGQIPASASLMGLK